MDKYFGSLVYLRRVLLLALVLAGRAAEGQTETEMLASDGASSSFLGKSTAASGSVVVASAHHDSETFLNSGAAYVFRKSGTTWIETKLKASDAAQQDYFGASVALDGNVLVVGSPNRNDGATTDAGAAYVFRWNGSSWVQEQLLLAPDRAYLDFFGGSVSISGDTILVGAYNANNNGFVDGYGAAYAFHWNGSRWNHEATLLAPDGAPADRFGWSVSISGDVAVVGAVWDDDGGLNSGSAYAFRRTGSTWNSGVKLPRTDAVSNDSFGWSVSLYSDLALVGVYQDDDTGLNFGSTYVYRLNGSSWVLETKLYGADSAQNDKFGFSVCAGDNLALIGAPNAGRTDYGSPDGEGAAYIFRKVGSSWTQDQKLVASDAASWDQFGTSVSLFGEDFVVGAHQHSHSTYYARRGLCF